MTGFVARRLATALLQLVGLALVVFFAIRLLPADPVARLVGQNASREAYLASQHALGLDRPVLTQFGAYLGALPGASGLLQGDFGTSWVTGEPVAKEIGRALPVTLELITISFVLAFILSVPLGMLCALKPGGAADNATFGYSLFAGSQPEFWWGLLFIYFFFAIMGWAPAPLGRLDPLSTAPPAVTGLITIDSLLAGNMAAFSDGLHHLMLPVLTKVFVLSGPIVKMVRQNMVRVLGSDYVLFARASGLPPGRIARMALKNALAPALTLLGVLYGYILGGAVLIETVFSLPGIGSYAVRSVLAFDYPAIQAVVLVIAAVSLFVYLALDIVHALLDPRLAS
ncbi:ABC transporter permease [Roseomonas sp. GC11]|uniref:ABC transporter permease n=1 Tax=Roseomonas sp. GC11 TaxID=2950546 RepID=UPI0021099AD3|nr:ABC transporter permease [Roseomonas sp. GC11]MCQ4159189.1 ABC transporter permease [Roseomonas sp. GC11]